MSSTVRSHESPRWSQRHGSPRPVVAQPRLITEGAHLISLCEHRHMAPSMAYPGPRTPSDYDRAAAADHAPLRLSAADIAETISVPQVLDLLAEGFRTVGVRTPRAVAESSSPRARLRGRLPEIPAYTVRIDVRMSGSGARSTVRLHDSTTDALL